MRILFSLGSFGFLRNFEPAIRLLASRGHQLHLVAERKDSVGGVTTLEMLQRDYPALITAAYAPPRKDAAWQPLATQLRLCLDYWRYLDERYDRSDSLRARAKAQAPALASWVARQPLLGSAPALAAWRRLCRAFERSVPPAPAVEELLRAHNPDLVLITPLLYFGSQQVDYVRAARALGIRTVLGVGSWDHLTTKGLIHELPDRVLVWNEMQRQEAFELHGVPPEQVTVTGAQAYDHWFAQSPSTTREEFGGKVGLRLDRPLLLYLCSSPFIAPYEVDFVRRWIRAVRSSRDERLRSAAILVRPHPQNAAQWRDVDLSAEAEAVAIWPKLGANPVTTDARAEYYDSMHHSAAVVGINTSALIESGIVGRPVYTILADEFAGQQEGTLHFQHLKGVNGGLLHVAATLEQHIEQISASLERGAAAKSRAFVEAFVRPFGLDVPAAERFVEAVEGEARRPRPAPVGASVSQRLRRGLLRPLAAATRAAARGRTTRPRRRAPEPGQPRSILFVLQSPEYLRFYDSTMRLLASRGHRVGVAVNEARERKHARLEGLLQGEAIRPLGLVPARADGWQALAHAVRGTMDFVRYLHPHFRDTPILRARIRRKVLPRYMAWLDRLGTLNAATVRRLLRLLAACERAIPVSRDVSALIQKERPDVLVVAPLVDAASAQVDTVRAAQALGVPVVAAISSWDNLTNKGHLRVQPDVVTVWNELQKEEAEQLHDIPPDRIVVTGAPVFDRWFERQPSRSREAFCEMVGLPDARPFLLYAGSSIFIARSPQEVPFVRRWIEQLRRSDDSRLREIAVLVRPHPFNCDAWETADFSDLGPVAIWPRQRYTPAAEDARASLFDSLSYCSAVVGINTSAMIEAAIVGKPVLSVLAPEFAGTQGGTIHFRYLLPENGGFVFSATSFGEHLAQLSQALRQPDAIERQTRAFVRSFVRPHGLDRAGTPLLADAIERAGATAREPATEGFATFAGRVALWPLAMVLAAAERTTGVRGSIRRTALTARSRASSLVREGIKHGIKRPVRSARRLAGSAVRRLRLVPRAARWTAGWCARRVMRGVRQVRYQAAMRLRR